MVYPRESTNDWNGQRSCFCNKKRACIERRTARTDAYRSQLDRPQTATATDKNTFSTSGNLVLCHFEKHPFTLARPFKERSSSSGPFKKSLRRLCDIAIERSVSRSYRKQIGAIRLKFVSIWKRKFGFWIISVEKCFGSVINQVNQSTI